MEGTLVAQLHSSERAVPTGRASRRARLHTGGHEQALESTEAREFDPDTDPERQNRLTSLPIQEKSSQRYNAAMQLQPSSSNAETPLP